MTRRSKNPGSSARPFFIGLAACVVVALALVVGIQLLTKGGGDDSGAAVTNAPTDHPSPATTGGPDLHFSTTSFDFGLVPLGKQVGYSFSFANVGAKTLRIGDVNVRAVKGC
jgi:hypothetical protein